MDNSDLGRVGDAEQALVNQAPSGLGRSGFDPSRSRQTHGDERQLAGARFVRDHDSLIERLFPKWADRRRRERAIKRYGWDFICRDCRRWVHAEQCAQVIAETAWHWHYQCTCGAINHIWLGSMLATPDTGKWGGPEAYENGPYLSGGKS